MSHKHDLCYSQTNEAKPVGMPFAGGKIPAGGSHEQCGSPENPFLCNLRAPPAPLGTAHEPPRVRWTQPAPQTYKKHSHHKPHSDSEPQPPTGGPHKHILVDSIAGDVAVLLLVPHHPLWRKKVPGPTAVVDSSTRRAARRGIFMCSRRRSCAGRPNRGRRREEDVTSGRGRGPRVERKVAPAPRAIFPFPRC